MTLFTTSELCNIHTYILHDPYARPMFSTNNKVFQNFLDVDSHYYWICWIRQTIHSKNIWENVYLRTIMIGKWKQFSTKHISITSSASFGINELTFSLYRNYMVKFLLNLPLIK